MFCTRPSYHELAALPLAERLARIRDPEVRARILAEPNGEWDHPLASFVYETFSNMLPVHEPLDWEPTPATPWRPSPGVRVAPRRRSSTTSSPRRRPQPRAVPVHQLLQLQPRRRPRHARPPGVGVGAGRRWHALRRHGRRQRADAHAHALGARPHPRPPRRPSDRSAVDDVGHRRPLRSPRPWPPRAGFRADLNVIDHERLHVEQPGDGVRPPGRRSAPDATARGYVATVVAGTASSTTTRPRARCPAASCGASRPCPRTDPPTR